MEKAVQYELRLAERMSRLGTETAFEVLNKARALEQQGKNIIHLEIGEPDFDTPKNIIDAAIDGHVSETLKVKVHSDEVVIVPGGKPIIFFSILALADTGDEVIYPNPGFPIYESIINYVGARPVPIRLQEEKDFGLDVNELSSLISDHTK